VPPVGGSFREWRWWEGWQNKKATVRLGRERVDRAHNVNGIANGRLDCLYAQCRRCRLDRSDITSVVDEQFGVEYDRDPGEALCHLLEQLQPLAGDRRLQGAESGNIALGSRNVSHQASDRGVTAPREDDRNGRRLLLQRPRWRPATGDNQVGREAYQLCCMGTDTVGIASRKTKVDPQVAAFDPAKLCERLL
jgi:hypothetical protein